MDPGPASAPAPEPAPAPAKTAKGKLRAILLKASISAAATAFLLVLSFETLGRATMIFGPEVSLVAKITEDDPLTGKRLKPGRHGRHVIVNVPPLPSEVGIRDNGIDPAYGRRVLALGDSFTYGDGVELEKNWTELLEPRLNASVINAGMGSTGPHYALKFLKAYGFSLEPDVVLYAFFAGNDILDAGVEEGYSVRSFGASRDWLDSCCVTYRAMKFAAKKIVPLGSDTMKAHRAAVNGVEAGFWPSMLEYNSSRKPSGDFEKAFEACRETISEMNAECARRGKKFAVAVFPFKEQVYFDAVKQWLSDPGSVDPAEPGAALEKFCRGNGIRVIDLTPLFVSNSGSSLYLPFDSHWNEAGCALAADGLDDFLKDLLE